MLIYVKISNGEIIVTHKNKNSYFNFSKDLITTIGNTAGLMMMNSNTFKQVGMFNENYNHCWEDVEINLNLQVRGFENYLLGSHCAYHYESKSRDIQNTNYGIKNDFDNIFIPFVNKNLQKLKSKIFFTQ